MTTKELYNFVHSLKEPIVKFGDDPIYNLIDLRKLTIDLQEFDDLKQWLDNKDIPNHLKRKILVALISIKPPENLKNELISFCL